MLLGPLVALLLGARSLPAFGDHEKALTSVSTTAHFPVVFQHLDACGLKNGRPVRTSVLPVLAVLLVARGSDRVIIPTPHERERERAESGVARLPAERQHLVTLCDTNGALLSRVRNYLEPLRRQVRKWPEDAFVQLAEDFLYEIVVATDQRAGILSDSASVVREFVPLLDPTEFSGEARFRLAEICRIVCGYEPFVIDHGQYVFDSRRDSDASAWEILQLAEFRAVVATSGRIGYLRHPLVALRRLGHQLQDLVRKPTVKPFIKLASTAADAAGAAGLAGAAGDALGLAADVSSHRFHPPFISIGAAELSLYRAALREGVPGAVPPEGVIMLFEYMRAGRGGGMWLNVGEERKLELEARGGFRQRIAKHREARKALARFLGA